MQNTLESRLNALHRISQEKLVQILDKISGKKDLIIDPVLMKSLDRITGAKVLRSHNVDKIYRLEKTSVHCKNLNWVYLLHSNLITAKCVCDQINSELSRSDQYKFYIILVPCELVSIQHLIEEEGLYDKIIVYCFPWELIRLDSRVLSYELPDIFQKLYVDGDQSFLPPIARSLWSLQLLFGKFPLVLTAGRFSSQIYSMMDILMNELGSPDGFDSDIGCLFLVDRDVDYASVLLTPVTYLGLLDEVFEIRGGTVELDARFPGNKSTVNFQLSGDDGIYNEIKHRYFSNVYSFLSRKVGELQAESDRRQKMTTQDMKQYVETELKKVINMKQALSYHIGACEAIIGELGHKFEALHRTEQNILEGKNKSETISYLEDCLATQACDKFSLIRLLCLMSLTQDGLTKDEMNTFKSQFLHCYGYEHLTCFYNLEKLGIFIPQSSSLSESAGNLAGRVAQAVSLPKRFSAFRSMAYKLKLFPDYSDDHDDSKMPKDMSYVFSSAYTPAVCQLIQMIINKGKQPLEEILKLLPAATLARRDSSSTPRTFLVYFVGGVTYAEIAAFELLEKLTGARIVVGATNIINGKSLIKSSL
ncbi:Vacuolar protein sorting-associated protein 33A [Gryllus bimaculatus]|nr:Vacuolar protein sorting-associated protein 33A [Gryllus bimaculatus]